MSSPDDDTPPINPNRTLNWGVPDDEPGAPDGALDPTPPPAAEAPEERPPVPEKTTNHDRNIAAMAGDLDELRRVSKFGMPRPEVAGPPEWATVPSGIALPSNKQVLFLRFRSEWTDNPGKGHPLSVNGQVLMREDGEGVQLWRECLVWPLNVADKRFAIKRAIGDSDRVLDEQCRQMIRAIDGRAVNWEGAGEHDVFWNELGEKCRALVHRVYQRLHVLGNEETIDFLLNCIAVRTARY